MVEMKLSHVVGAVIALYASVATAAPTSSPVVNLGYAQYGGIYNASSGFVHLQTLLRIPFEHATDLNAESIHGMAFAMHRPPLASFAGDRRWPSTPITATPHPQS
jgi:hypothetical protein